MSNISIPIQTKRRIFNKLKERDVFEYIRENNKLENLVKQLPNIDTLPSQDHRFKTFYEDFVKHCVHNTDWDDDELFLTRLHILNDETVFHAFLNAVVSTDVLSDEDKIQQTVQTINGLISSYALSLQFERYSNDGLPIYKLRPIGEQNIAVAKVPQREFQFFVDNAPSGRSDFKFTHTFPKNKLPCFALVHDAGWNDFDTYSSYDLFWHSSETGCMYIGPVKIIHRTEQESETRSYHTKDFLSGEFNTLNDDFVSLGQTEDYYNQLKKIFPKDYKCILSALRDCAINSSFKEAFELDIQFKSLVRTNEAEQLLREVKFKLEGIPVEDYYHFAFKHTPKYTDSDITLDFSFTKEGLVPRRLYVLIGENGVGKTQFLKELPRKYASKEEKYFSPHLPMFSKVLTVSTSIFDDIDMPVRSDNFAHAFCGLSMSDFTEGKQRSDVLKDHLHKAIREIYKYKRNIDIATILKTMLPKAIFDELIEIKDGASVLNIAKVKDVVNKLSSGEASMLITFCDVIAKIRYDTLLLIDEPETHLHPKAIQNWMNTLFILLEKFQSYAIVATHSSLIVREVLAECVYVIKRIGDTPIAGKIKIDCFGANLDELNEEIFGATESNSYYHKLISNMVSEGYTYDEIMGMVKSENLSPNLNLRVFVKNLCETKKEQ